MANFVGGLTKTDKLINFAKIEVDEKPATVQTGLQKCYFSAANNSIDVLSVLKHHFQQHETPSMLWLVITTIAVSRAASLRGEALDRGAQPALPLNDKWK